MQWADLFGSVQSGPVHGTTLCNIEAAVQVCPSTSIEYMSNYARDLKHSHPWVWHVAVNAQCALVREGGVDPSALVRLEREGLCLYHLRAHEEQVRLARLYGVSWIGLLLLSRMAIRKGDCQGVRKWRMLARVKAHEWRTSQGLCLLMGHPNAVHARSMCHYLTTL